MKPLLRKMIKVIYKNLEAIIWAGGLGYLAFINPYSHDHVSLCPFNALGFGKCPGCGLGESISLILHGDFTGSFGVHILGLFALLMILYRIISLLYKNFQASKLPMEVHYG